METLDTKFGRVVLPTPKEDAAIQAGIEVDSDSPEWTDQNVANARPAREVLGDAVVNKLVAMKRPRGRPAGSVSPNSKVAVNLRVDPDVLEAMRATGTGWQTRVNDVLRREFTKAKRNGGANASAGPTE